ncbi:hypothetical protein BJF79_02015 [Actinomadura sp. CNU-125]|uniref:hypothetical protein n=1 Tax=Actinomadura sp. CNU-125 TaxID=1904961 RepID=UPI000962756E|nr:hypothetical protein [Actinomadura sp. CNU-125]OLT23212.1 hypothetical protein BJF79_02015 [Actinomadura sp. CNU-125]
MSVRRTAPSGRKFEDDVVLSGTGHASIGRRQLRDPLALTVEACRAAVDDAGLTMDDIEHGTGEGDVTALEAAPRIRAGRFNGGGATRCGLGAGPAAG